MNEDAFLRGLVSVSSSLADLDEGLLLVGFGPFRAGTVSGFPCHHGKMPSVRRTR